VANTPCCEIIKLTKPTNTFRLSRKVGEGELSAFLKYEDGDIIKVLKAESISGNEIILTETIDPKTIEPRYKRECIGDYLEPIGEILRQDIFVEVFYKP
jgi:hypothetical protein